MERWQEKQLLISFRRKGGFGRNRMRLQTSTSGCAASHMKHTNPEMLAQQATKIRILNICTPPWDQSTPQLKFPNREGLDCRAETRLFIGQRHKSIYMSACIATPRRHPKLNVLVLRLHLPAAVTCRLESTCPSFLILHSSQIVDSGLIDPCCCCCF